jgi:hypothetical protein
MKKIYLLVVASFATALIGVVGVVSASAATLQWLAEGKALAVALASETKGELLLESTNGGGLGVKVDVLCSGVFDGTVGPGAEDQILELLTLEKVLTTLEKPLLNCVVGQNCTEPEISAANLPWLTRLELMGTEAEPLFLDVIENGGPGNPGWEVTCLILGVTVTEVCTTEKVGADLTNDATEKDVLATFEGELANCTLGGKESALLETSLSDSPADEVGLITLNSGEALSVSYE